MIHIRPASPEDMDILRKLFFDIRATEFFWCDKARIKLEDFDSATAGEKIWVATVDRKIAGFCALWETDNFIHHLFVDKNYRTRGMGKALLAEVLRQAQADVTLKCVKANTNAVNFYLANGGNIHEEAEGPEGAYYLFHFKRKPENTPILETERLILRKLTDSASDMQAMFAILSDEKVNTFLPWYPAKNLNDIRKHAQERYFDFYAKDSAYRYVICLKTDNLPIGYVGLSDNESHDFGYGLRSDFWHRGIATEAAQAVVERIKNAGCDYITATHDVNNPRSGEVMKKLGMKYCYSYVEQWMPKNIPVTFRMYQLNFDGNTDRVYREYWDKYPEHFIDKDIIQS